MKVTIFGAGGLAKTVFEWVEDVRESGQEFEVVGFLDGDESRWGESLMGRSVLGGIEWLSERPDVGCVVAIGNPGSRARVGVELRRLGVALPNIVHPRATVASSARMGVGNILCPNVTVGADAVIGDFVIANIGCVIGHDSEVRDFVHVGPGVYLSGHSTIGARSDMGTTSATIQGVSVGDDCVIGAGAMITKDIPKCSVAVGVPAKVIKTREL